jgi:SpoIID/LytB domain protein
MTTRDRRWVSVAAASWLLVAVTVVARQTGPAYFLRSLDNPADRRESRSDVLDRPVLPGSIVKAVTLVAALESQVIEPGTRRVCRRVVTIEGARFACAHPDLRRPLTPAEALAHSCHDFFASLAPRLSREAFNQIRIAAGLPPVGPSVPLALAFVGLDGPRVTPRSLVDVLARLVGAGPDTPVRMRSETRAVLREGLIGGAVYGSASALGARGLTALVKTGTAPLAGGAVAGLLVALAPADRPVRGLLVIAPGSAGPEAAGIAADLLEAPRPADARAVEAQPPAGTQPQIRLGLLGANGRASVESLDLEEYVARVVAGEGEPRAGEAAREALAIAVRTFALANLNRHRREGFDLCDSTHCQVVRAPTAASRHAAESTAGRVLLHRGAPAYVFYSAWCGGRSARPSEVWPGAEDYAFEPSVDDDACRGEAGWDTEVSANDLERVLRTAGLQGGRLRDLRVLTRTASGRVARLRVDGFTPGEISGTDLRAALGRSIGWQRVRSTAFDVRRTGRGYRFTGRGYGHGVGLCVVGAGRRAEAGATLEQILQFYYPGLQVGDARGIVAVARPDLPAPSPAAPSAADIRLALPVPEEGERARLLELLRNARDGIARRAGVRAPAPIQVTVHPNAESFGRATGQPWWAAGATLGSAIDLVPIAVLRQQGQLERAVRHEIAHVLVDPELSTRPLWVREGAALYFAQPEEAAPAARRRIACPTDAELLRPVSAGAQREAYARAEACFRRGIAEGKAWRDVR